MNADKLEINNRKLDATGATATHADARQAQENRAQYAKTLAVHFQAYIDWAIDNWPGETVLTPAFFKQSADELNALCAQLGLPASNNDTDPSAPGAAQFVPVAPMPWP